VPSGGLQDEAAGTGFELSLCAECMISISDNTTTNHLIQTLDQRNVEEAIAAAGHSDPALNFPFLMTRELFLLKWRITAEQTDA
jgi:beta-lactamase class A